MPMMAQATLCVMLLRRSMTTSPICGKMSMEAQVDQPGREFTLNGLNGTEPDSGQFTVLNDSLGTDSGQVIRISRWDTSEKSFKSSAIIGDSAQSFQLSMWSLDSGTQDDWNLMARYEGNIFYNSTDANWRFTKTSTLLATQDALDSGDTYYIKIDGVW